MPRERDVGGVHALERGVRIEAPGSCELVESCQGRALRHLTASR